MKHKIITTALTLSLLLIMLSASERIFSQISKPPAASDNFSFQFMPPPPGIPLTPSVLRQNFTVTLRDGVLLDATKFFPSQPNPFLPDGYPCVIMVHGYGDRKETLENFAQAQATYNYVVYTYSVRGQGNSGGLSNLISKVEAQDLIEFVNFIKHDQSTGLDSSKIVITGGSQGGTLPYMAACMGMKVNSIISALTSPKFATSWIENGSVKMTLLWSVEYTPDSVRYTPVVNRMSDWIYQTGFKNSYWDSLAIHMPQDRDFNDIVSNNTVPLLIENSWQDYFFNTRQGIESLPFVLANHRVYFGAVMGHGGDISNTENIWHMDFFNDWFYYYVWDVQNNILTRDKFHFAYTTYPRVNDAWSFVHDSSAVWPPQGVFTKNLFLNTQNALTESPAEDENLFVSFKNEVSGNLTMTEAVHDEFTGANFNSKFKKDSVYFETLPLSANVKMVGTPQFVLEYSSSANICQYNMQLFEVLPDGTANFITRINYTDRYYTPNLRKKEPIEGKSHAHIFQAGSKIRIVVKNLDWTPQDYKFLRTNPQVLPVLANSVNKIYLKGSIIELPLMNFGTTTGIAFNNQNSIIESPELHQNYPNPFNPATIIRFDLPQGYNGDVQLKIFDITGREVTTLVNKKMTGGSHSIEWNAAESPTGVYFYKLTAENFSSTKRMILIK